MRDRVSSTWGEKAIRIGRREHYKATGRDLPVDPRAEQEDRIKYMESYLLKDKKYIPYEKREAYAKAMKIQAEKQREHASNLKPLLIVVVLVVVVGYILYSTGALNIP
ncbi:MAG: hypothetical protein WC499_04040 [Patescibacteria group bacterium]